MAARDLTAVPATATMLRPAIALLTLAVLLAGCDLFSDSSPSTFSATYSGAASGTATGSYAYTEQFFQRGVGSRDHYQIIVGEVGESQPGVRVVLSVDGVGEPSSTFTIGNGARASFTVGGLAYEALAGTFTVARRGDRFVGTFDVTDSLTLSAPTGPVQISGRFDVARTD